MSNILRTPPASNLQHTSSDSDVSKIASNFTTPTFVSQRNKRCRQSSDDDALPSFRDEFKSMFEEWQKSQDTKLSKLIAEVIEIKEQNKDIKRSNEEIEKSMIMINGLYENMKKKVEGLEAERKQNQLQIAQLEMKIDDMQRSSKASSIEIRNIPLPEKPESKADLCEIVQNTGKALQVSVDKAAIRDVFRLNGRAGKGTIIAEFTSVITKNDVINACKTYNKQHPAQRLNSAALGFKSPPTPIYVSEALTSKGRRLFFLARDLAKSHDYKFCWTSNGKVFLRKTPDSSHIEIKDENQLISLKTDI